MMMRMANLLIERAKEEFVLALRDWKACHGEKQVPQQNSQGLAQRSRAI
jgi:hypothetical protein